MGSRYSTGLVRLQDLFQMSISLIVIHIKYHTNRSKILNTQKTSIDF